MRVFRRLLLIWLFAGAGVASALAQTPAPPTPETLQAAKDLVGLISKATVTDLAANINAQIWPQIDAALRRQIPKIDDATLAEMRAEYERMLIVIGTQSMNDAPPLYARYFTASEMNEIAAFYKTPAGAKALTVMPKVMGDFTPTLMARLETMKDQLSAGFDGILKKHGYQK